MKKNFIKILDNINSKLLTSNANKFNNNKIFHKIIHRTFTTENEINSKRIKIKKIKIKIKIIKIKIKIKKSNLIYIFFFSS
jgi:hypothetical protein